LLANRINLWKRNRVSYYSYFGVFKALNNDVLVEIKLSEGYYSVLIKTINPNNMTSPATFPTALRQLLRTQQAFLSYAATHVQKLDLTLPQFDIIITLGNTPGMPYKKLGEKTLITKGTLTGVISRLEEKGLVQRVASETDGRSQIVRLTEAGTTLFESTFSEHLQFINRLFNDYSPEDIASLEAALVRLHEAIITARNGVDEKFIDEDNE